MVTPEIRSCKLAVVPAMADAAAKDAVGVDVDKKVAFEGEAGVEDGVPAPESFFGLSCCVSPIDTTVSEPLALVVAHASISSCHTVETMRGGESSDN